MSTGRFLELWMPPAGYRLVSVLATTYQLQADFLEEDLLPVALGLRIPAARGRDFRIELEQALQNVDVTIYLHPDGYQAGLRRSPRIDLIPIPESRAPKLHAKVSLLHYVPEKGGRPGDQIVRLVIGSANLTSPGYRDNIEVAASFQDSPDGDPEAATAVRDAEQWLRSSIAPETDQARQQHRSMQAVFSARPVVLTRATTRFIGLPRPGGLPGGVRDSIDGDVNTLTLASPFWPTGDEPSDVVAALLNACGGKPAHIRLIGPAQQVDDRIYPEMPPNLLARLVGDGITVEVAAADPTFGCSRQEHKGEEEDEYGDVERGRSTWPTWRPLHAKMLLLEGERSAVLTIGSFNFTRKGLGLHGKGNTEAGMLWRVPNRDRSRLAELTAFAKEWHRVGQSPEDLVLPPKPMEGASGQVWPVFILSLAATRDAFRVRGRASEWPEQVTITMRDLRSRLVQKECSFDAWVISRKDIAGDFERVLPLSACWLEEGESATVKNYPPLPDLEVELAWDDQRTVLPVVFVDKDQFPVLERSSRENERALIDWFLGLRPAGESDAEGFAHSIDPVEAPSRQEAADTTDILSYLVRDFVHALPGVRALLIDGASTETGLKAALFGPRSPVALANEVLRAWQSPDPGTLRKTTVATAFQLVELIRVVKGATLHELPDGATERLREKCLGEIHSALSGVSGALKGGGASSALAEYLQPFVGGRSASA